MELLEPTFSQSREQRLAVGESLARGRVADA
jgi:hypothetical protein